MRYNHANGNWNNVTNQMASDDGTTTWCEDMNFIQVFSWNGSLAMDVVITGLEGITQAERHDGQGGMISFQYDTGSGWSGQVGIQPPHALGNLTVDLFALGVDTPEEVNGLQLRVLDNDTDGGPTPNYELDYIWLQVSFSPSPPAGLDLVAIDPHPSATIQAGDQVPFIAQSYNSTGDPIDTGVVYTWSFTGVGNLTTSTGNATVFFSNITGVANVSVTAQEGPNTTSNSTLVMVTNGSLSYILISPMNAFVYVNESQDFSAQGFDVFGNPTPDLTYSWVLGNGLGSLNVSMGQHVRFDAGPSPSTGLLNVTNASTSASASIQVIERAMPSISVLSPSDDEHLTGTYTIQYLASADATMVDFEYFDGSSWSPIGSETSLDGSYDWATYPLNVYNVVLRTCASNMNGTACENIINLEIDNLAPNITITSPSSYSSIKGTYTIEYQTDIDVTSVEFRYFDGSWHSIGIDNTVDGQYIWDVSQIHLVGVTLEAKATDEVDLIGETSRIGIDVGEPEPTSNRSPVIEGVPDVVVHYDYSYNLDLTPYITDEDNTSEELSIWTSDDAHIWTSPENNLGIVMNYPQSMLGETLTVTIWVTDGVGSDFQVVNVTVTDNYPPEKLRPLPDVTFNEDDTVMNVFSVNLDFYFLDIDGDNLYYTSGNESVRIRINENRTVDMWAEENWFGFELITIRATDPTGGLVEDVVIVQVNPVNDPPVMDEIAEIHIWAQESHTFDLISYIHDVDSPFESMNISTESEYATVSGFNLTLHYPFQVTEENLMITVSDGLDSSSVLVRVVVHSDGGPWLTLWLLIVANLMNVLVWGIYMANRLQICGGYLYREDGSLMREISFEKEMRVPFGLIRERIKGRGREPLDMMSLDDCNVSFVHGELLHLAVISTTELSSWALSKIEIALGDLDKVEIEETMTAEEREEIDRALRRFERRLRRMR